MTSDLLEHALAAVAAGVPVFPLLPGEKRPDANLAPNGWQSATLDPDQVRAWWQAAPRANIGGAVGLAGITVIDLDMKGANGALALMDWEIETGVEIAKPVVVRTASGGQHVYLRGATRNRASMLPGVDVRGEGGYVVLPGSVVNGVRYAFLEGEWQTPVPDAPAKWIAAVGRPADRHENPMAWLVDPDLPANIERARTWLRREIERGKVSVEGEGGDLWTVKTAAMLRDFGVSEDTALDLLDTEWNPYCTPPWEREDLARKVQNAYRYAQKPGGIKAAAAMQLEARLVAKLRERSRQRFSPLTWEEIQNLPEPRWLLPGTLPEHGMSMIYGPQASYKSFLALSIALDVATGRNSVQLADDEERPEPRPVLYIAGEGSFGLRKRIDAWWQHNDRPSLQNFRLVAAMPALANDDEFAEFVGTVTDAGVIPALVVVDTVARAMYGYDENSALDMGRMVKNADAMKEGWRCNVLMIHHSAKAGGASRGSGALPAAVDTELKVSARKRTLTVTMTKQKDAEQWETARQFTMKDAGDSVVPVPKGREEPTDPEARAEVMDTFDAALRAAEVKRDAARDEVWEAAFLAHLDALSDMPNLLPVSVSALATQIAEDRGENRTALLEWVRGPGAKRPAIRARVELRDNKNRPSFMR